MLSTSDIIMNSIICQTMIEDELVKDELSIPEDLSEADLVVATDILNNRFIKIFI